MPVKHFVYLLLLFASGVANAKVVTDTLYTATRDTIIVSYSIIQNDAEISIEASRLRFYPSDGLRKKCKNDLQKLKLVVFDRVGVSSTKFNGEPPRLSFSIPANISHEVSGNGFYILKEPRPITFKARDTKETSFEIFPYLAMYEKKNTYSLIGRTINGMEVQVNQAPATRTRTRTETQIVETTRTEKELVAVQSTVEVEADNSRELTALQCIDRVRKGLMSATRLPFPSTLEDDRTYLSQQKYIVTNSDVLSKIDEILMLYDMKKAELEDAEAQSQQDAQAQVQALQEQQQMEMQKRQEEAEEKRKEEEQQQQKRNLWMMIGGAILMVLCFVFNGIFKHFKDIRNQKNMFKMQQDLTNRAEREAVRRAQQIARNKTHQMVSTGKNKARAKIRQGMNGKTAPKGGNKNEIKTI